ncbi:MAG: four helix bundle protein [Deltaproteobacteria bacterium]|jgi:four helix bundle protein|nr:four helix bundle protein [Deltaproteobacteria bacterium]
MKNFRDLQVWQKSHQLTLLLYNTTRTFPEDEKYGLVSQIKRSAASIAANIAEGCGKNGDAELGRYLQIAMGSASELEYHLLLAHDLKMVEAITYEELTLQLSEIKKMLASFIKKLKAN